MGYLALIFLRTSFVLIARVPDMMDLALKATDGQKLLGVVRHLRALINHDSGG